jgi:hypothetical protein
MTAGVAPYPHPIRLRGPWASEVLADPVGRKRFRRRFGYPGRIDDFERVWLTFAGLEGDVSVWLNGQFLGRHENAPPGFDCEVTALLKARNEVVVETSGESPGEVALEVRRTAFLRGVRTWAEWSGDVPRLHITGEVIGTAPRPLELYVILDRFTVAYGLTEAVPEGRVFTLASEVLPPERWQGGPHLVRVDLVDGASVWYALEQAVAFSAPGE